MLKSKIHRAKITDCNLNYTGSISIDAKLMDAANIAPYEQVSIYNIANGERFETYAEPAERGSGNICVNGAASRRAQPGDLIIIACYVLVNEDRVTGFKPKIIKVDNLNGIISMP
jgi:aspartate 1-decarboxylase